MREILICTVGTSLINNISRESDSTLYKYLKDGNLKGLSLELGKISPDNRICGAEINSIHSIIHSGYLNKQTSLKLLVSDTDEGRFTGDILSLYYRNSKNPDKFNNADFEVVEGLSDVDVLRFKNHGLRNLVRLIGRVVKTYDSQRILINATGGYKAQISFAGMIGQALEIPVCYMFEKFSEVIQLPPQPISLDLSFWLENVDTFFELDEGVILQEDIDKYDARFSVLIEKIGEGEQHLTCLSPTGQLFHETFRHRFARQRTTLLPKEADLPVERKKIRYEDKNKGKHKGLDIYLSKILEMPYVKEIYTHYYNPDLLKSNLFRKSSKGIPGQIEGWFGNAGALTKFDVITTANTSGEQMACKADLNDRLASK